jgi:hypothetical protein
VSTCGGMCPSVRKVPTKVATFARRRNPGGCAVKLNRQQSQKLLQERGIWITEACDRCGRLLGSVCWTQRGEPGDWCSAECRDGVAGPVPILKATAKECLECGVPLQGKRSDSEYCTFSIRVIGEPSRNRPETTSTARDYSCARIHICMTS